MFECGGGSRTELVTALNIMQFYAAEGPASDGEAAGHSLHKM